MSGPHDYTDRKTAQATERAYGHIGIVTSAPSKPDDGQATQLVEVTGETFRGTQAAEVVVPNEGDTNLPSEGARVLVSFVEGEHPIVVGQLYSPASGGRTDAPAYEQGDRRIGHAATDANVTIDGDGTVTVEAADGTSVEVSESGTVSIDGGGTGVVTDIETTTDGEGDVTDVTVTRSDTLLV